MTDTDLRIDHEITSLRRHILPFPINIIPYQNLLIDLRNKIFLPANKSLSTSLFSLLVDKNYSHATMGFTSNVMWRFHPFSRRKILLLTYTAHLL